LLGDGLRGGAVQRREFERLPRVGAHAVQCHFEQLFVEGGFDAGFEIDAGREVYELLAPDGSIYVMQAYAQIVDPTLTASDLPGLGARLSLPAGWSYRARTLDAALVVDTPGMATVLQDELQNSYSRHVDGSP